MVSMVTMTVLGASKSLITCDIIQDVLQLKNRDHRKVLQSRSLKIERQEKVMNLTKVGARSLVLVVCLMASLFIGSTPASAASPYDDIVQTTTSVELQTSTAYCANSAAIEHNTDWATVVSAALSTFNSAHGNAIADWESDWDNKVGWAVYSVAHSNDVKTFTVLYSASYGQNVFFNSGNTDYFTIYDPTPVTPFRTLTISTKGNNNGNCNDEPWVVGASTGGLSASADSFNTGYKLFLSTFTTFYPSGYEGVLIPSEYTPPPKATLTGTVDCIDPANQPAYMYITQAGNNGYATLTYASPAVADWSYDLTSDPYQVTVGCGDVLAASFGSVDPTTTSEVWICDIYENPATCRTS